MLYSPHFVIIELVIFSDANASFLSTQSLSSSLNVLLMCTDSDVRATECKLISDWGPECVRRDCFLLHAVICFQGVSAAL